MKKKNKKEFLSNDKIEKHLDEVNGVSKLYKVTPKFMNHEYVIENYFKGEYSILQSDKNGKIINWKILANKKLEDYGY